MDAYRDGEHYVVHFDLPGVDPSSVDLNVERSVLTVKAERIPSYGEDVELQVAERPRGVFSRQLFLGDILDTDQVEASYDAGVLTPRIPVAEKAKPRKIEIAREVRPSKSTPKSEPSSSPAISPLPASAPEDNELFTMGKAHCGGATIHLRADFSLGRIGGGG